VVRVADERVFVGLGGNVGNRPARLTAALRALQARPDVRVVRLSPVYETSPVGPQQRDFLNAVAEIRTSLDPAALLAALKSVERSLGRRRRKAWGPREIDLDIVFYGRGAGTAPGLTWPHPRFRERKFVLQPLCDVAPRFRDPVTGLTVRALLRRLKDDDQTVRLFRRSLPWTK
jgi:2-amino-4-hydroxy-6-hydroxymethyldihydropteridine diphosphokinase